MCHFCLVTHQIMTFWPFGKNMSGPNTYLGNQCERVDYNLIIGFSLSFSGDADAVTLNLLL